MKLQNPVHALTIDVEDWFSGIPLAQSTRDNCEHRLRSQMDILLRMLDDHGAKGTFFWLGELAVKYPDIVRSMERNGHRIGCHGYCHQLLREVDAGSLKKDIFRARNTIQDILGSEIISYRAPFFSIDREHLWVLDYLVELGFKIDSSIFPIRNWRYGMPGFPDRIQTALTEKGRIWLAPISIRRFPGFRIPVSGGAYFRIYPYNLTRSNLRSFEKDGRISIFYIHPWELDPSHPRISFDPRARLTHYANLQTCREKFDRLLSEFSFVPLEDIIDRLQYGKINQVNQDLSVCSVAADERDRPGVPNYLLDRRSDHQKNLLSEREVSGTVMLDIGTRDGELLRRVVNDHVSGTFIGIDIDIEYSGSFKTDSRVLFVQANAESLPFLDNTIDTIICSSVYKHIWDVKKMLAGCFRVLKPGGTLSLVIVTPFGIRLGRLAGHFDKGTIRRIHSIADVRRECTEIGFDVISVNRFALPLRVPGVSYVEAFIRKIGLGWLMFYQSVCAKARKNDDT